MHHPARLEPAEGQESVWDYPRPPALEPTSAHILVRFGGKVLVDTSRALRLLETSHPPTYYLPFEDIDIECFEPVGQRSLCEWKGQARYFDVVVGQRRAEAAAWTYDNPFEAYPQLKNHVALYADKMDECRVDGELVTPQPGGFYGGWVTSKVTGPFKGIPGSWGW